MGKVLPLYYEGALLTLRVGAIGILLALAVGMVTAVARYWRIPILNTAAVIYTEFSRNTPLLVQLFFLYFGLPKVGIRISGEWCAIIGLAFLGGSYMAEALRAGLESVSTVQTESARVLGLTPLLKFSYQGESPFGMAAPLVKSKIKVKCIFLFPMERHG